MERISALLLCAGRSSRMGSFKPLLPLGGMTVIERSVKALLTLCEKVVVVTGKNADQVEEVLSSRFKEKVLFVRNSDYASTDMLHSVRLGLSALPKCDFFFLQPADIPLVSGETLKQLLSDSTDADVIFPSCRGRRGHPVLICSALISAILSHEGEDGMRGFFKTVQKQKTIEAEDEGILLDLDTPEDYEKAKEYLKRISAAADRFSANLNEGDTMKEICKSVVKKDHDPKIEGRSVYVGDYKTTASGREILTGKLLRSPYAKARVLSVKLPDFPEGYCYVDKRDIPGDNNVNIVLDDTPVFCRETVEYIGEPLGMVVGPDEREVDRLLSIIEVDYEELEPVLDLRTADQAFFNYEFGHGDVEKAFADADKVYEEEFVTGYQDQTYLEPQGMMAEPEDDGRMFVHGSLQCAYYVHGAVARAMGTGPEGVHILQDVTGGGFGGKEDYPSILGCQVAVAAKKTGKPVRCVFGRREDLEVTPKRHPSLCKYKVAVKDGRVTAVDADVRFNAGAYSTLSAVVLQRGIIAAPGVYDIPNVHVTGKALKTNTNPCGAYRGFGAPQTFFAMEMMMSHIAQDLGEDSIEFKERHFVKKGDTTSTNGRYHFPVPLPQMLSEVDGLCELRKKHKEYSKPQTGRYRRGIGFSAIFHGAGFTGSGERDMIKATAKLRKYKDGSVEVLASNGDIGQGVRTTFPKIVAHELNIPLERVYYDHPDTARVPDSGPTVASRSLMIVGELLRRAAIRLRDIWVEGEEQEVEEHYKEPDFMIPFYLDRFEGDAYPTYAWAASAVEVEADTLTGLVKIVGAYGSFDVGTPVDYNIVVGQMEGGFLQGLGYASIEKMNYDGKGRIRNNSFTDYLVPTTMDVPNMKAVMHIEEYPDGPYGAKGAGELPLVAPPPAYLEAVEQALGGSKKHNLSFIPFSTEDVILELNKEGL